jgi:DMSO/TMAO reductase YedYZ molybdopterin-dependent catalytic subunit
MEKATRDAMLAYAMNGATLNARHGFPVRAIVPGWFGMASTKWVTRIRLEDHPSDNHFMVKGYRYTYPGKDPASAPPVEEMLVKSIITRPLDGEHLPPGPIAVAGFAWAGDAGVRAVEVTANSVNGSVPARLLGEARPNAWRAWTAETGSSPRGRVTILACATDGAGVSQPLFANTNAGGYGNNSVHRVIVHVV